MKQSASASVVSTAMREPVRVPEHVADHAHALAGVEHLGRQRLPSREGEELAGQPRRAVDGRGDGVDIADAPLLADVGSLEQVDGRADHGEQVVEIVRDAAGEPPDRLHLLRLPQRLLRLRVLGLLPQARGHVRHELVAADPLAPRVAEWTEHDLVGGPIARLVAVFPDERDVLAREAAIQPGPHLRLMFWLVGEERQHVVAHLRTDPENALELVGAGPVDRQNGVGHVNGHDHDVSALDHRGEQVALSGPRLDLLDQLLVQAPKFVLGTQQLAVGGVAFNGERRRLRDERDHLDVVVGWGADVAVVDREGSEQLPTCGEDRRRPARPQAVQGGEVLEVEPQRVGADVADVDGRPAPGGGAA